MAKKTTHLMYLQQLYAREAHELYQDEKLLGESFDLFRQAARNPTLAELFERARRESLDISSSLQEHLESPPGKDRRPALRAILEAGQHRVRDLADSHLVDAELIASMHRLLGYQIAGFQNLANFARLLGESGMHDTVERAIEHKKRLVDRLSKIALHQVHWRATWWAPEHTSAWDRVKAAFRRDWEQTKAHVGAAPPPEGGQSAGDTMAQLTGRQEVMESFETDEPAFRYGYGAAQYYHDREWDPRMENELRANYGGFWDDDKERVFAGWRYARPERYQQEEAREVAQQEVTAREVMVEEQRGPIVVPPEHDRPVRDRTVRDRTVRDRPVF
jgi:ferritin-like metal-binding protein YciE